jgi:2',3'-cyclic-nucleotide 2'-phosphodiesterase (5'-nucleotidase family)
MASWLGRTSRRREDDEDGGELSPGEKAHRVVLDSPVHSVGRDGSVSELSGRKVDVVRDHAENGARSEAVRLTILCTSDLGGRLEAMARLSSFARRLRAEAEAEGRRVFLWDAGNAFNRDERICRLSKGLGMAPILKAMGCALQTMDVSMAAACGLASIAAFGAEAGFPVLGANCREDGRPLPAGLRDYVMVPLRRGLAIGVVGLTSPSADPFGNGMIRSIDFRGAARTLVERIHRQGPAPIVVCSHLGLQSDRKLARAVPGIDVILGARSNTRLAHGEERDGVLIAQAGQGGKTLGRLDLSLDPTNGRVLDRTASLLDVPSDEPPDPAVVAAIARAEAEAYVTWSRPIGHLTSPLELHLFSECSLGNLAADALREHFGADAAIVSGGLMSQGLPAGDLSFGQLDQTFSTTASPCLTQVLGEQIREALERGLSPEAARVHHPALKGAPMGSPQISGLTAWYDPGGRPGRRLGRLRVQGKPLVSNRIYRVAHTAAESLPGCGCLELRAGQTNARDGLLLCEVVEEYIKKHSPVAAPRLDRWIAESQVSTDHEARSARRAA